MDQDSERDFNWENNIRINYKGEEDDIMQSVDAGNVSLSLPGSQSLMGSASHQGLFGVKTVSKRGPQWISPQLLRLLIQRKNLKNILVRVRRKPMRLKIIIMLPISTSLFMNGSGMAFKTD
ncbi:MAG: hypothetical protein CM1200mP1_11100 [Candidatus Neomarinimicrobiota bacterium]|nr:MAG: hypothetical protein CM1200mP1_11100 [Candidatus Neomarinimicrobiota bacterium]